MNSIRGLRRPARRTRCAVAGSFTRRKLLIEQLEKRVVLATTPVISEFLASNSGGLTDSDLESSDWIELYNPTSSPFDLSDWALTDDPDDLNQWLFPAVTLEPNDFLVVFASGQNRAISGQELHTNFRLGSAGDYLALVQPDGTVVSEYSPTYPQQTTNVSYGLSFNVENYIEHGSPATTLIPSNNSIGSNWTFPGFDDSTWIEGDIGVGYGVAEPGFNVRYVKARSAPGFDGSVTSLAIAETVLATPAFQSLSIEEHAPVVNYLDTGGGGRFGNDLPFPNQSIGDDINHFVIEVTGTVEIPSTGSWSFGVNSDDGFGLSLARGGSVFTSQFPGTRGSADTIQAFNVTEAGTYDVRLVMFEAAGGASVELFASPGALTSFGPTFRLVGDTENGGLPALVPYTVGGSDVVNTDIQTVMQGINTSAYVRVPFVVNDVDQIDSLLLTMRYDDGFAAYINGAEIARANAPTSLTYNSVATVSRPIQQVREVQTFVLDVAAFSALIEGENVLAIHGLNDALNDDTFLVLPELVGTKLLENQPSYFATPTPGNANVDPVLGIVDRVVADVPAGFFNAPISVSLSTTSAGASIRYTLDGSTPTELNGTLYSGPITVSATTNLRAVAYEPGYVSLPSITRTYLYLDDVLNQSNDGSPPTGWPATWNTNVVDYGIDPDVRASETDQRIKDALLALPTFSITTDLENLFDPAIGIYSNAQQDGRDWERPAAVELLNPDGTAGFQVNSGLRIRGGFSRSDANPKHALKLFFRGVYGDATLEYPIHGDEGVSSFDKLDLRTPNNYSWSFGGDPSNNFVAEVLARYNQRDMGEAYTRSTWIHLYLNGQYWGLYQTQERADANYAASYFGGEAFNYDVIKPERGDYRNIATDGNFDAYTELWSQANARATDGVTPAFVDNAAYLRAQGKNPDRSENLSYPVLLDVPNLIVYMLETIRGGNLDAPISAFLGNNRTNNYFAIRDRTGREGFRFMQHDGEHTMRNVNENRNGPYNSPNFEVGVDWFNPQWLHQQLMANDEYRMQFADAVQFAFFNDGPLSTVAMLDKVTTEANKIDLAVVAESARWGDAKRAIPLGQNDFRNAIDALRNNYLPARNNIVLNQLRNTTLQLKDANGDYSIGVPAPLYPTAETPKFLIDGLLQHGGEVPPGSMLDFSSPSGTVYYTLDGSDPRLFGGGINPAAFEYTTIATRQTVVETSSLWRYLDNGTSPSGWNSPTFSHAAWATGQAELGYGDGDEATVVSFGPSSQNKYITTYFRQNFFVDEAHGLVTGATLRLRRDDGAAVYINGVEAVRSNLPSGTLTNQTLATVAVGGDDEVNYFEFAIDPSLIQAGGNLIAVSIHQSGPTSSDISFDAELIVDQQISNGVPLNVPTLLRARAMNAEGVWSALEQAEFIVDVIPASAANLRVTEVNFNPAGTGSTEFIELRNISHDAISLAGVRFTTGITYDATTSGKSWMLPGEVVVLTENIAEFTALYGTIPQLIGQYSGALSNGGETLTLLAANNSTIQSFTYDDQGNGWHASADGGGYSLTIRRTSGDYNSPTNWRPSFDLNGTPGVEENDAPIDIALSSFSIVENAPHAVVGLWTADDLDDFDTAVFELLAVGDWPDFTVVGNELRVGPRGLDYEAGSSRTITIRVADAAGETYDKNFVIEVIDLPEQSTVIMRGVAYNGATAAYGSYGIAPDIVALLPGGTATRDNFTNYWRGLNRIVIDLEGFLGSSLTNKDLRFNQGNSNEVTGWKPAPLPESIDVIPGGGINGSTRVVLTWSDKHAIRGQWLETTVLASGAAKLAQDEVFYFGNQIGDVNGAAAGALVRVDGTDWALIADNYAFAPNSADIANDFDVNRDGRVNLNDNLIVRYNWRAEGELRMISPSIPNKRSRLRAPVEKRLDAPAVELATRDATSDSDTKNASARRVGEVQLQMRSLTPPRGVDFGSSQQRTSLLNSRPVTEQEARKSPASAIELESAELLSDNVKAIDAYFDNL